MKKKIPLLLLLVALVGVFTINLSRAEPRILFEESFPRSSPSKAKWNLCQYDKYLDDHFETERGEPITALRIGIDSKRGNPKCECVWKEQSKCKERSAFWPEVEPTEETKLLTPTTQQWIQLQELTTPTEIECAAKGRPKDFSDTTAQKNEIRLYAEEWYDADIGHWFSFRFKIDGKIEPCGSKRWVGGQFKIAGMDSSPFIAQRFDNGIFHVTIEALHHKKLKRERVIVAKAEGNPDLYSRWQSSRVNDTITCDMSSGKPNLDDCGFAGKVIPASSGKALPSIENGKWVQMDYYIKIEKGCDCEAMKKWPRKLHIWADGEKIAEVIGGFGALRAYDGRLKFKIGVYRDNQTGDAGIVIDQFTIRADPEMKWSPKLRSASGE